MPRPKRSSYALAGLRDRTPLLVGLIAAGVSIASTYYYLRHQLVLGYQDSFSHLELSRRLVAGLSPGIAQLGGVWLPVPQVLESLFSWNYTLYRLGLAGAAEVDGELRGGDRTALPADRAVFR